MIVACYPSERYLQMLRAVTLGEKEMHRLAAMDRLDQASQEGHNGAYHVVSKHADCEKHGALGSHHG